MGKNVALLVSESAVTEWTSGVIENRCASLLCLIAFYERAASLTSAVVIVDTAAADISDYAQATRTDST